VRGGNRYYYLNSIEGFLIEERDSILGQLVQNHEFSLVEQQRNAWSLQIKYLKEWLGNVQGQIIFEYSIPRMGKRIDCVIISGSGIFVIEFKVGENSFSKGYEQLLDYALDLKNFHKESHHAPIIPILICTEARSKLIEFESYDDGLYKPIFSSGDNLNEIIYSFNGVCRGECVDADKWISSEYYPTPTIIEAAQALYQGHCVEEISRSDAGAYNLTRTSEVISEIVQYSKTHNCKSICFLTGVPGAGKTLAGLNLANRTHNVARSEHAVFLSGNGPLVQVLREALARDEVAQSKRKGVKLKKNGCESKTKVFIQNIHHFRDEGLKKPENVPLERVVVFDEAQRAWDKEQTAKFMKKKKDNDSFDMSEPEFLISYMNRHEGWATVVCLIGGGQEINRGEAGLQEWFNALDRSFSNWSVFVSPNLDEVDQQNGSKKSFEITYKDALHLSVSIRSFRSEKVSDFVKALLESDRENARSLYEEMNESYPIVITRDLEKAKKWIKEKARGSERYGIVASSGGLRLRPEGVNVKAKIDPKHWFLNDSSDVRSSYFLEEVATEFDIQGLELDWAIVAWDADLRFMEKTWDYKNFRGDKWTNVNDFQRRVYLKNAYRVLLTRARQGMVIFVPCGDLNDKTRQPEFYSGTYEYLQSLGLKEI
jgi:hypothetical protein